MTPPSSPAGRPDILHLHRGPVYPPSNGEERRVWETANKLSEFGTVWLAHPTDEEGEMAPGVRFVDVENPLLEHKSTCIYGWNALLAVSADHYLDRLQTWQTVRNLKRFDGGFDLICCESPQVLRAGVRLAEYYDAPLLLNKHNAMFDLLDQQLRLRSVPGPIRERAVENLRTFEQRGIDRADAVVFQSESDRNRFRCSNETTSVIPNGTHVEASDDTERDTERLRKRYGLPKDSTVCLFVGAYDYDPNAAAAGVIIRELAPALPEVQFLLVGRDPPDAAPENVHALGFVDDLAETFALADIALCPLTLGSGTKLKMMDYLAAGLPIVTTEVGAQGIPLEDGEQALIRDSPTEFVAAIRTLRDSESLRTTLAENAAALGRRYRWDSLLRGYDPVVADLLDLPEGELVAGD